MTGFEWAVVMLLALIALRSGGNSDRVTLQKMHDQLTHMQQVLVEMHRHLGEIDASTSSASNDISAMRLAQLPPYPPDRP